MYVHYTLRMYVVRICSVCMCAFASVCAYVRIKRHLSHLPTFHNFSQNSPSCTLHRVNIIPYPSVYLFKMKCNNISAWVEYGGDAIWNAYARKHMHSLASSPTEWEKFCICHSMTKYLGACVRVSRAIFNTANTKSKQIFGNGRVFLDVCVYSYEWLILSQTHLKYRDATNCNAANRQKKNTKWNDKHKCI